MDDTNVIERYVVEGEKLYIDADAYDLYKNMFRRSLFRKNRGNVYMCRYVHGCVGRCGGRRPLAQACISMHHPLRKPVAKQRDI